MQLFWKTENCPRPGVWCGVLALASHSAMANLAMPLKQTIRTLSAAGF